MTVQETKTLTGYIASPGMTIYVNRVVVPPDMEVMVVTTNNGTQLLRLHLPVVGYLWARILEIGTPDDGADPPTEFYLTVDGQWFQTGDRSGQV
jgi:hypothetical protein